MKLLLIGGVKHPDQFPYILVHLLLFLLAVVEICPVTRLWAVYPIEWRRWYCCSDRMSWYVSCAKGDDFPYVGAIS